MAHQEGRGPEIRAGRIYKMGPREACSQTPRVAAGQSKALAEGKKQGSRDRK